MYRESDIVPEQTLPAYRKHGKNLTPPVSRPPATEPTIAKRQVSIAVDPEPNLRRKRPKRRRVIEKYTLRRQPCVLCVADDPHHHWRSGGMGTKSRYFLYATAVSGASQRAMRICHAPEEKHSSQADLIFVFLITPCNWRASKRD